MIVEGTISQILPIEQGTSSRGAWKKQLFIVATEGAYENNICFSLWGDKTDAYQVALGKKVEVSFNLTSREYNGKWYTEAKAWKVIEKGVVTNSEPATDGLLESGPVVDKEIAKPDDINDDKETLPF